jgi:hypothetical protein
MVVNFFGSPIGAGFAMARNQCNLSGAPQHCLNFFPLPQGHGSLRPIFRVARRTVCGGERSAFQ